MCTCKGGQGGPDEPPNMWSNEVTTRGGAKKRNQRYDAERAARQARKDDAPRKRRKVADDANKMASVLVPVAGVAAVTLVGLAALRMVT